MNYLFGPFLTFCFFIFNSCSHRESQHETSVKLNKFFDQVFESQVARYPTWQTYLGRKTNYALLDNETPAFQEEEHQITKQTLEDLKKFPYAELDKKNQLSYRILEYQLEKNIEANRWRYHSFPLNQMFGYQSETPSFLINMHQIDNAEDAEAYISRLKEIRRVFSERLEFVRKQQVMGIVPPHFVFSKVIEDSHNIIHGFPFQKNKILSPLYQDFKDKMTKLKLDHKRKQELLNKAQVVLKDFVRPAYVELISHVQRMSNQHKLNLGAWSLPQGKEFYDFQLRTITTTKMDAETIHKIGLEEVKRIQAEMLVIMKKVKFTGSLNDFFQYLRGKKFLYPNTPNGRKAYLAATNQVVNNIKAALPKLFHTFPKAPLLVKPVEAFREKSAGTAFYSGPSMDGNRPGIYYVNLYKMADNPIYKLEALAYHEAIPGHHMQISISKELDQLPKFRREGGDFTAYVEGWGLYSELVPKEIGFYQDPYSDFGRLSMEIWRSARLVVDTGIHFKKWSREEAIKYLSDNTPSAELETIKEIERYFIMPGQATAYKVGMMKILSLREKAKKALGDKFNIADFHDVILREGALPLDILEENVEQWIKR